MRDTSGWLEYRYFRLDDCTRFSVAHGMPERDPWH
jgi:hypothetical protein